MGWDGLGMEIRDGVRTFSSVSQNVLFQEAGTH